MRHTPRFPLVLVLASGWVWSAGAEPGIARTPLAGGAALAVRVADAPLVFTGQIASPAPGASAQAEAARAVDALARVLESAGGSATQVVRLAVYAADDLSVAAADTVIAERFAATPVAVTVVRTPIARAGARLALEAVAVSARTTEKVAVVSPDAAVLPAGGKIFISGQAERGPDLAAACRATMTGLQRSVAQLGLTPADIVQVKAFIRPFADHAAGVRAIAESFGAAPAPPIVVMEWVSDLFAEIEIVVSARTLAGPKGGTVAHSWLPWLTHSPRYCHVAHVPAGTALIFLGAIDGGPGDARVQIKAIFGRLGSALFEAGSSFRHLAKASYYLHDPAARMLLGSIRDVYYDPTRPPAASALQVAAPPRPGQAAAIDLIAVPVK